MYHPPLLRQLSRIHHRRQLRVVLFQHQYGRAHLPRQRMDADPIAQSKGRIGMAQAVERPVLAADVLE